ncbi:MAG: hypothetical protein JWO76_915 [Nocardioides sp.]|nr:hypothetical protein [Nocardioides sp.]
MSVRASAGAIAVLLAVVVGLAQPARADRSHTHTGSGASAFFVTGFQDDGQDSGDGGPASTVTDTGHWISQNVCESGGSATCVEVLRCEDGTPMVQWIHFDASGAQTSTHFYCPDTGPVVATPQVTGGMVLRALRRIDLPQSQLIVQPPGGETLVNFATNFYTEQGQLTRTVHLLGQRVDLKIWPSQFGWRFGDGRSLATESAGSPYPDLEITHEYARAGGVRPSVDTTYAAQFRVNGGPWRDVNGTVTIPGSPLQLQVRTASPILVGYR